MFSCSFQVVWITGASRGIGMRVFNLMYCETMTNMICSFLNLCSNRCFLWWCLDGCSCWWFWPSFHIYIYIHGSFEIFTSGFYCHHSYYHQWFLWLLSWWWQLLWLRQYFKYLCKYLITVGDYGDIVRCNK